MNSEDQQKLIETNFSRADAAERYLPAEKGTGPFGKILVEKAGLAQIEQEATILDFATGTGVVVKEIYNAVPKDKWKHLNILGADSSPVMIDFLKTRAEKEGWTGVQVRLMDGTVCVLHHSSVDVQ